MRSKIVDLITEGAKVGRAYKLAPRSINGQKQQSLAVMDRVQPKSRGLAIDSNAMTVSAVISTAAKDRAGDILIPTGCDLEDYRSNPVVLWNHGLEFQLPIAKSCDADENLTVHVSDSEVTAVAYFNPNMRESCQIFELIADRFVRATSVQFDPERARGFKSPKHQANVIDYWPLLEWSFCPIGCNQEAIVQVVESNRLAGDAIAEPIMKSLKSFLPQRKVQSPGIGPGIRTGATAMAMAKASSKSGAATTKQPAKAAAKGGGSGNGDATKKAWEDDEAGTGEDGADSSKADDMESSDDMEGGAPGAGGESGGAGDPGQGEGGDAKSDGGEGGEYETESPSTSTDESQTPYGAQIMTAIHARLAELSDEVKAAMGPLENVSVKEALDSFMTVVGEKLAELEGAYSSAYPDREPLVSAIPEEGEGPSEAEALKSLLATSVAPRHRLNGLGVRLKSLTRDKNLTGKQRATIDNAVRMIGGMIVEAKKSTAAAASGAGAGTSGSGKKSQQAGQAGAQGGSQDSEDDPQLQVQLRDIQALKSQLADVKQQLKGILPAKR